MYVHFPHCGNISFLAHMGIFKLFQQPQKRRESMSTLKKVLAEKIGIVLSDLELQEKMSRASRKKAEKEFDIKHIVKQYIELYNKYDKK